MNLFIKPWVSLWENRELILKLSIRKIDSKHRGSFMGVLWMILDPLLILGVYLFVFGFIFQGKFLKSESESRLAYGITVFLGLAIFRFFSEVIASSPASVISNSNYVKKIVFPLEILPIIDIIVSLYSFFVTIVLVVIGLALIGDIVTIHLLWLPMIIISLLLMITGIGWIFSSLTVYILDVSHIIQFLSITLLFSSAIFYPLDQIPPQFWNFLKFNPLLHLIESARCIMIWHKPPPVQPLLFVFVFSISVYYLGYTVFNGLRKGFADVL